MIHERFTNKSAPVPDLAYARGSGSRERGSRGEEKEMRSQHASTLTKGHTTKREGGWNACL